MPIDLVQGTRFIGARAESEDARVVLFGCPFDGTCTFRPGARFGPPAIRSVSDVLETYCPVLKRDLEDLAYADVGDLVLPPGDTVRSIDLTYQMARQILASGQISAGLGGEHLLSYPLIKAAAERYPDMVVVQFDAHMDMRNEYLGVKLSHATVMRRVSEIIGTERILHVGQRSGTRAEFETAADTGAYFTSDVDAAQIWQWIDNRPVYITVDLDVLDPSILPGTGTPEPGGVTYPTLERWLSGLAGCRWVAWDVMELSPPSDPTQISSIVAAKVVRTMLLASTAGG